MALILMYMQKLFEYYLLFYLPDIQGEVRISKKDYESEDAVRYGGKDLWHHVECFSKLRNELQYFESGDSLPGFVTLTKEDQKLVTNALPKVDQ